MTDSIDTSEDMALPVPAGVVAPSPQPAAAGGEPSAIAQILDALRLGRIACEWCDEPAQAEKIAAAMEVAKGLAATPSPSPAPAPAVPSDALMELGRARAVVPVAAPSGDESGGEYTLTFHFGSWNDLTDAHVAWTQRAALAARPADQGEGAGGVRNLTPFQQRVEREAALPYWEPCNPGCDPELNGERSRYCGRLCEGARKALAAHDAATSPKPTGEAGVGAVAEPKLDAFVRECREIGNALRDEYGEPYTYLGVKAHRYTKNVYVGRAGALLHQAQKIVAGLRKGIAEADDRCEAQARINIELAVSTPSPAVGVALEALTRAKQFIENGVELGYIRMPDKDCPDPAHETPAVIDAAIASLRKALETPK